MRPFETNQEPEAEPLPQPKTAFELFCYYHADRVAEWMKHHKPHDKLPIVETPEGYQWINRSQRRGYR